MNPMNPNQVALPPQKARALNVPAKNGDTCWRTAATVGLATLTLLVCGCSKGSAPEQAKKPQAQANTAPASNATEASPLDEVLAPVLKTPWKGDLDAMAKRRVVRVLLPFRRPEFFYMEGRPAGILHEAFQEVERALNAKYKTTADNRIIVVLLPTALDKLRGQMVSGWGDIGAYNISITDRNKADVDLTIPTMTGLKVIVVTGPGTPELKSIDDLSGKEVWVNVHTRMKDDLDALNARFRSQGKAPAIMRQVDPVLDPADIMEMVNVGTYPITLMQSSTAQFWGPIFDNAKPRMDLAVAENVEFVWAIQKGTPQLKAFLDDFLKTHGIGTSFGNTLMRRYLKETKYVRNARDPAEMEKFRATIPFFKKYAGQYGLDYLLLGAQGYQESRLDQNVKSPVGAIGIMQVMPSTAAASPVNVPNVNTVENNIHAGVRMIHFLVNDYFDEPGLDQVNRTLLAIAAYNAGPAKITNCRDLATKMGYDRNRWFGNVEVATAKVVGRETTQYVANIYKYYLAYRMAAGTRERRREAIKKAGAGHPTS
jgi:membrane-bound lytic murein transglycosylase MltF